MWALRALAVAALAAVAAVSGAEEKVSVVFVGESGCPFCRAFVAGPLSSTYAAEGVADIMDLDFLAFGNAYFVTKECGGPGSYDTVARQCFNRKCGRDAAEPALDCFSGDLVCQHGPSECVGNRLVNCAQKTTGEKFLPFVFCFEAQINTTKGEGWLEDLASDCTKSVGADFGPIKACYDGPEGALLIREAARATPWHPSVPYVLVDGQQLQNTDQLLHAVCSAYKGPEPQGCKGLEPLKEVVTYV